MDSKTILWATTFIMTAGGLLILLIGKRRTDSEAHHTICHGIVPILAACSYFAMASGQGAITLPIEGETTHRMFYFARYIDWFFTTPLLLSALASTATHTGSKLEGIKLGMILADVLMIVTALFFGLSVAEWIKWTWFIISCVAFLGVYYALFLPLMQAASVQRADVRDAYRREAVLLSVWWFLYPVVLALSPDGARIWGETLSILAVAVLDVVAKVAFGLLQTASTSKTTDRDLTEDTALATRLRQAA